MLANYTLSLEVFIPSSESASRHGGAFVRDVGVADSDYSRFALTLTEGHPGGRYLNFVAVKTD